MSYSGRKRSRTSQRQRKYKLAGPTYKLDPTKFYGEGPRPTVRLRSGGKRYTGSHFHSWFRAETDEQRAVNHAGGSWYDQEGHMYTLGLAHIDPDNGTIIYPVYQSTLVERPAVRSEARRAASAVPSLSLKHARSVHGGSRFNKPSTLKPSRAMRFAVARKTDLYKDLMSKKNVLARAERRQAREALPLDVAPRKLAASVRKFTSPTGAGIVTEDVQRFGWLMEKGAQAARFLQPAASTIAAPLIAGAGVTLQAFAPGAYAVAQGVGSIGSAVLGMMPKSASLDAVEAAGRTLQIRENAANVAAARRKKGIGFVWQSLYAFVESLSSDPKALPAPANIYLPAP